jgi:glycosyltransferase involved in cell wall biosynthesis
MRFIPPVPSRHRITLHAAVRVLLLNQYFHPDLAASGQRFTDVAETLAAAHDVTAIVGQAAYGVRPGDEAGVVPGAVPRRYAVTRVWSTSFSRQRPWGRIVNYLTYVVAATLVALLGRRPDVVVAATDPPVVALAALVVGRLRRAPFVYCLWDIHPEITLGAGIMRPGLITRFTAWANRRSISRAAAVVTPTDAMARTAVALGANRSAVHVLPLWEDTGLVRPEPKDNPFSRRHGLVDRFVLMYSGNMGLTQGLDRYLALPSRLSDLPDFQLVLVGDGAARPLVEARARALGQPGVMFVPYQPREEMRWSLASADVLFAPNLSGLTRYMLPSKVYTYMASGRPFIAAIDPTSDLADTIRRLDCGTVVAPDDLDGLEREVRRLHARPDVRQAMGQRGRQAAEAEFSKAVGPVRYRRLVEHLTPGR